MRVNEKVKGFLYIGSAAVEIQDPLLINQHADVEEPISPLNTTLSISASFFGGFSGANSNQINYTDP